MRDTEYTTKYALRHIKEDKLLTFYVSSNGDADFCGDTQTSLGTSDEQTWYAKTDVEAEYVRQHSTQWYNAGYETPSHEYKPEELEVVCVEMRIEHHEVKVKIPTYPEYIKENYEDNKPHRDYCLSEYEKHGEANNTFYSIYDLQQLIRKREDKLIEQYGIDDSGAHSTHCCHEHQYCKYGQADPTYTPADDEFAQPFCPVVLGVVKMEYGDCQCPDD